MARRAMRQAQADPTGENLHQWRKATKTLWYQLRLVRNYNVESITPLLEPLDNLGRTLGAEHDLTVAIAEIEPGQGRRKEAKCQRKAIRVDAFAQGQLIFAPKPKAFARSLDLTLA
ncbi:MAG: CHAD domain-containing protein [Acidimicrobiales bacterium]